MHIFSDHQAVKNTERNAEPVAFPSAKESIDAGKKPNLRIAKFVGVGILAIVLLVVAIGLMKPSGDDKGNSNDKNAGNITEASKNYQDTGYSFSVYPGGVDLSDYSKDYFSHNLNLVCSLFQDVMVKDDPNDIEGGKVQEIRITDFELTGGPKLGKFSGILGGSLNMQEVVTGTVQDGDLVLDVSSASAKFSQWSGSIVVNFNIDNVATYTYPVDAPTISFDISYQNAGIKSDDLRFGIRYKIEMITKSGKTYSRAAEVQPLGGDFLYDGTKAITDTRTFDPASYKPFVTL